MALAWNDDMSTGLEIVDTQHRELFARIGALLEACRQGKEADEVGRTMSFLASYVDVHFSTEEGLMRESGFPGYAHHRKLHQAFCSDLEDLKRTLAADGPGLHIVVKTNRVVTDWLVTHIGKADKAFGLYARARR